MGIDDSCEVFEYFCRSQRVTWLNAQTVAAAILDALKRFNLSVNDCKGQAYDGAISFSLC